MTSGLRRRHRRIFLVLALVLPGIFVSGLLARRPFPASDRLPELAQPVSAKLSTAILEEDERWRRLPLKSRLLKADGNRSGWILDVQVNGELPAPDLLIYWSETAPKPEQGVLLGSLAGRSSQQFALPERARAGHLVLYSLAHGQVVAEARLAKGEAS